MALPHVVKYFCFSVFFLKCIVPTWDKHFGKIKSILCYGKRDFTRNAGALHACSDVSSSSCCMLSPDAQRASLCGTCLANSKTGNRRAVVCNLLYRLTSLSLLVDGARDKVKTLQKPNASTCKCIHSHSVTSDDFFRRPFIAFHLWLCRCVGCEDDHILHNMLESKSK